MPWPHIYTRAKLLLFRQLKHVDAVFVCINTNEIIPFISKQPLQSMAQHRQNPLWKMTYALAFK